MNSIYECKDGRVRIYIKDKKKVISYPKYLMEQKIGRELEPDEEVHHKDENPLNNDISNLELRHHGEHQREHGTKYHDIMATCAWCGKEFLWTGPQQQRFYSERRIGRHHSSQPFCSRSCSGHYGQQLQVEQYGMSANPRRKLSPEDAKYIREYYIPKDRLYGERALAMHFGVDKSVIHLIINGKTYKDVM